MSNIENLQSEKGVEKLKLMVKEIEFCLFCSNLKTDNGSTCWLGFAIPTTEPKDLQPVYFSSSRRFFTKIKVKVRPCNIPCSKLRFTKH